MSVQLTCDQCGKVASDLFEIRPIVVAHGAVETYRTEWVTGQVHWECIVPFVGRKDAEHEECPF